MLKILENFDDPRDQELMAWGRQACQAWPGPMPAVPSALAELYYQEDLEHIRNATREPAARAQNKLDKMNQAVQRALTMLDNLDSAEALMPSSARTIVLTCFFTLAWVDVYSSARAN